MTSPNVWLRTKVRAWIGIRDYQPPPVTSPRLAGDVADRLNEQTARIRRQTEEIRETRISLSDIIARHFPPKPMLRADHVDEAVALLEAAAGEIDEVACQDRVTASVHAQVATAMALGELGERLAKQSDDARERQEHLLAGDDIGSSRDLSGLTAQVLLQLGQSLIEVSGLGHEASSSSAGRSAEGMARPVPHAPVAPTSTTT